MAWNGRKSERRKAVEAEESAVESGEGLIGKDIVRVDLSVLATSPRGKSGPRGEQLGRLVRMGQQRAKRERLKAKLERKRLLGYPGCRGWENRREWPWRVEDTIVMAFVPGERVSAQTIMARVDRSKAVVAGTMHQKLLIRDGFVGKERIRTISAFERGMGVKGHEVEWFLTEAGIARREEIRKAREDAELEALME